MYLDHFGLEAEPFSLTPDPEFLYLSPGHAESLAALTVGIRGRRGLMAMTWPRNASVSAIFPLDRVDSDSELTALR